MSKAGRLTKRRLAVLSLLAQYGPLSIRGLEACIAKPIKRRKLNQLLASMEEHGQLTKTYARQFGRAGVFYRISGNEGWQATIAEALEMNRSELAEQGVRGFDLLHSEACAMWNEYLRLLFPEATVIHESNFSAYEELQSVLLQRDFDRDFIPDLVMMFPENAVGEKVYVAFEIERSPKKRSRLQTKLSKYADETRFDGVVYICQSNDISRRLSDVYNSSIFRRSLRIQHYGANFFLFSDGTSEVSSTDPLLFNAALDRVKLSEWIMELRSRSLFDRRDSKFLKGQSCPQIELKTKSIGLQGQAFINQ